MCTKHAQHNVGLPVDTAHCRAPHVSVDVHFESHTFELPYLCSGALHCQDCRVYTADWLSGWQVPAVPGAARVAGEEWQNVMNSVLGCQFPSADVTHRQIPSSFRQYDRSSLGSWVSKAGLARLKPGHRQSGSCPGELFSLITFWLEHHLPGASLILSRVKMKV